MYNYHNDYDEKVLSRSREKVCELGKPYVDWSQYHTAPKTGNWVMLGLLSLCGLIAWALVQVM